MIVEWEPEAVRVVVPSAAALAAGAWVVEIPGLHRALLTSRAAGTAAAAFAGAASAADAAGTDPSFLRVDLDNAFVLLLWASCGENMPRPPPRL